MAKADQLFVRYVGFTHEGIDVGDGTVVALSKKSRTVERLSKEEFRDGRQLYVREYGKCSDSDTVVGRALSLVGKRGYNLFRNNCEHFATWCKTGRHRSEQVKDDVAKGVGVPGIGLVAGGGIKAVHASGGVVGLSGEGTTAGLGAVGKCFGGGPAMGLGLVVGVPAAAAAATVHAVLNDDESLAAPEREARAAGRAASAGAAVVGTAGSIGAVAAVGVPGLSAVGISTGLTVIGGGSIGLGLAAVVAGPVVLTLMAGFLGYRLFRALC